jgi:SpoVK/Ycf46/Vps4 family AAA+-type ATPase
LYYVLEKQNNLNQVEKLKEMPLMNGTHFIADQEKEIELDNDIYIRFEYIKQESKDEQKKSASTMEIVLIHIYSNKKTVNELKDYLETIKKKYLKQQKNTRYEKQFIYFLNSKNLNKEDENDKYFLWNETEFQSNSSFDNIFFEGKEETLRKIDFFLNNKEWYQEKGIPYNLGIGLSGSPGTGKTSFIKALAKYTNRHLIIISLKSIKNISELRNVFNENTYNRKNDEGSIPFDKKILVFEDIDCIGEIIKDRNGLEKQLNYDLLALQSNVNSNILNNSVSKLTFPQVNLTLDDFLNLWDGIEESYNRIIILTSNHYDKLDKALVRPGRIDIYKNMKKVNKEVFKDLYSHLFETNILPKNLERYKEYSVTPAEMINIFQSTFQSENEFMEKITNN